MKEKSSVMGGQVDKVPSKDNRAKDSSEKKIAANRDYITNNKEKSREAKEPKLRIYC